MAASVIVQNAILEQNCQYYHICQVETLCYFLGFKILKIAKHSYQNGVKKMVATNSNDTGHKFAFFNVTDIGSYDWCATIFGHVHMMMSLLWADIFIIGNYYSRDLYFIDYDCICPFWENVNIILYG